MTHHFPTPGTPEDPSSEALHTGSDETGWTIWLDNGEVSARLQAPTEEALEDLSILVLRSMSENHWTSKSKMVRLARACGVDVTENNTIAEIQAAIAEA